MSAQDSDQQRAAAQPATTTTTTADNQQHSAAAEAQVTVTLGPGPGLLGTVWAREGLEVLETKAIRSFAKVSIVSYSRLSLRRRPNFTST